MADDLLTSPILTAKGRESIRIPARLVQAVNDCDAELRRNGMQMVILCEHCHEHGHRHPVVMGDNTRFGSSFTMTCPHAERRYDLSTA